MNNICFATVFFHADGTAPNIKTRNKSNELKYEKYYQCMVVLFASLRRFYTLEKCIIFTDRSLPENYQEFLDLYRVNTVIIDQAEQIYVANQRINNHFPGCLFTLDAIRYCDKYDILQNSTLVLLDSDVVAVNNPKMLLESFIVQEQVVGIKIDYPFEKNVNGQSRSSLYKLYQDFYETELEKKDDFIYYGGEFYFISPSLINKISSDIDNLIKHVCDVADESTITEEHVLSVILNNKKYKTNYQNNFIKRVWTAHTHNNISGNEYEYCLLHMPAEKDRFFESSYILLSKDDNYLNSLSENDFRNLVFQPIEKALNPGFFIKIKQVIKNLMNKFKNL